MFNIGPQELLVVLIVALIIVGPKRLPEFGRTIGRALNEFRKLQDEVKDMVKFDLGADPTDDEETEPSFSDPHEPDESYEAEQAITREIGDGDGLTHSERVIAALPDEGLDEGLDAPLDREPVETDVEGDVEPIVPLGDVADLGPAAPPEDAPQDAPEVPPAAAAE
jgi:Tat protein translocase TatB subunit